MFEVEDGTLPPKLAKNILGFPTWKRWDSSLPAAVGTAVDALQRDNIADDSVVVIADGTPSEIGSPEKVAHLDSYFNQNNLSCNVPIYILTIAGQRHVADMVEKQTKLPRNIIDAIVVESTSVANRQKLAILSGSYVAGTQDRMTVCFIDDDTTVPREYHHVADFGAIPNGQAILDFNRTDFKLDKRPNGSFKEFLAVPGLSLAELKNIYPNFKATETWVDTMHRQLNVAQEKGLAIFEVKPHGDAINEGIAWSVSAIKHRRPDYRTVEIAKGSLLDEFPTHELPIESFPAGPNVPFGIRHCMTNIDSAFCAIEQSDRTSHLPFSLVISRDIGLQNPLRTVTINTRSDNELLPSLLPLVQRETGESFFFVTGINLQVEHSRESSGYRPSIIEQAAGSLVDKLYADAVIDLLRFPGRNPSMDLAAINNYSIPEARAMNVFRQFQELAQICQFKIYTLSRRTTCNVKEEFYLKESIQRYRGIYQLLKDKLGVSRQELKTGHDFPIRDWDNAAFYEWKAEIDKVGKNQLRYFNDVLRATPVVTEAIKKIIADEKYPVAVVSARRRTNAAVA